MLELLDSDVPPLSFDTGALRRVLLRALNPNQLLILSQIETNGNQTITGLLNCVSTTRKIPLSTLKLNARILHELNLIDFEDNGHNRTPRLTNEGRTVLQITSEGGEM